MDTKITQSDTQPLANYGHSISMVIKSFKGRRDVEVHLFRSSWQESDEAELDWNTLIADANSTDQGSRNVVMETFSPDERDRIVNYLKEQYSTRLSTIRTTPLSFPVPPGLTGLSQLTPNKNMGLIEFERIPSYSLGLPIKGLYDLDQHPPIVEE